MLIHQQLTHHQILNKSQRIKLAGTNIITLVALYLTVYFDRANAIQPLISGTLLACSGLFPKISLAP